MEFTQSMFQSTGIGNTVAVDSTARCRMPTSTPTAAPLWLPTGICFSISTVKEANQLTVRSHLYGTGGEPAGVPGSALLLESRKADWVPFATTVPGIGPAFQSLAWRGIQRKPVGLDHRRHQVSSSDLMNRRGKGTTAPRHRPRRATFGPDLGLACASGARLQEHADMPSYTSRDLPWATRQGGQAAHS
jgi:hypothetical protein